jgi:putative ABC transport system permease protein
MALGAERRDVVRMVLRETLPGLSLGLLAALGLGRWRSSLVQGVSVADPLTLGAVAALLAAAALGACLLPALRASRVDPTTALRYE